MGDLGGCQSYAISKIHISIQQRPSRQSDREEAGASSHALPSWSLATSKNLYRVLLALYV
jgi:hypothetical protein